MKQKIKNIFKLIFGTENNLLFNISFSSLITGLIFALLAIIASNYDSESSNVFVYISSICFSIWMIVIQGSDSIMKLIIGFLRLIGFFLILIYSLNVCLTFSMDHNSESLIRIILASIGLFACSFYIITKITSVFNLVKNLFIQIKIKLFNSSNTSENKFKALIENVTAFLVSIGGLTVAIKIITESVFQILDYLK